jgi:hypothetical protein
VAKGALLGAAGLSLLATLAAFAHERLRVDGDGVPLEWPQPANIGIVINSQGSDDIPDGSHETALRLAIEDWNDVEGSDLHLAEDATTEEQARSDYEATDLHLILFDETNASGYFGGGGIVAITPVWFFSNGQILDADVLFNGAEFEFTTSAVAGRFDVGDVGTHELGHLLGLDHSGWAGATMYPYVDPAVVLQRSPSLDEVHGAREIAPAAAFGTITGSVERASDSSAVPGAHVVARDADGRTAASVLSDSDGDFALVGLETGTYTLYADPLDAPVSEGNLGGGHTIETDFETTYAAAAVAVTAGSSADAGVIQVGADVALSLGSNFDTYPLRAVEGETVSHTVRGALLAVGSTLSAADPDLALSNVTWFGNSVTFQVAVPAGEPRGHVDLEVLGAGGALNILPGALEITPPSPSVSSVVPTAGASAGGTALTLSGTNFAPGARVVIGDRIYRDGEPGGCTVVDAATITLTTLAMLPGEHDVVVLDTSGVEGRLVDGFTAAALPTLNSVFPSVGSASGGTEVVLRGADFAQGLAVRIDGVTQTGVVVEDTETVRFATHGGVAGGPYALEVENPGGGLASSAFVYVAAADPTLAAATPDAGGTVGGTEVTLQGTGFGAGAAVFFGVDPDTGLGGVAAPSVDVVDANTIVVSAPAHAKGPVSLLVVDGTTGQVALLVDGFSYVKSGGSGGGGCYLRRAEGPLGPGALLGAWWILLLGLTTLGIRRWRAAKEALSA